MMQKKLIVVALTAAIALPVSALAENGNFTFYGKADLSFDTVNTGNGTTTANGATAIAGTSKRVVSSNVSKFGFKGSEDLGDGLSANWQVESLIVWDGSATSTFATRNTFVNLKSEALGTVLLGIHDTPYKIATRKLDPFGDTIGDNRALLGAPKSATTTAATATVAGAPGFAGASSLGFELRPTDILAYISPVFAGVTAAVARVNLSETNYSNVTRSNSVLSMAVMYDVAPFYGSVAHESHKLDYTVASGAKESATRLGFAFKPEGYELGVVYEKTTDNLGAAQVNKNGHNAFYVSGKMMLGIDAVKLGYTKAGVMGTGAAQTLNSGASQISVGYDHGLSKRTKVYAIYTKISNGKGINYGFSQSSGAASTASGFGTTPSALALGLQHSF